MWEWAGLVTAVTGLLGVGIKGVPIIGKEYRKHVDWRDKRTARQARDLSTVSSTTGTITKRSA